MNRLMHEKLTNIDRVEIFHVLHSNIALLIKRRFEHGKRDCDQRFFTKVLNQIYPNLWSKDEIVEIEMRLPCLLSQRCFSTISKCWFHIWYGRYINRKFSFIQVQKMWVQRPPDIFQNNFGKYLLTFILSFLSDLFTYQI